MDARYYQDEPAGDVEPIVVDVDARDLRPEDIIMREGIKPLIVVDVMAIGEAELVSVYCKTEEGVGIDRIYPFTQRLQVARWEKVGADV